MSIFDIMDEISERQILKTESGDNRIFGVVLGIVTQNYNKDMPGRICVNIPVRDKDANELKWARVAMPSGGDKWGHYFLPEIGDQVLIAFEQGNIEKPYVIGCIPMDSSQFMAKAVDEKNQYKKIMTKNGSRIVFTDNKEGGGGKDQIAVITAGDKHKVVLDNDKKSITVEDGEGKNRLVMKTGDGQMEIRAEKKLTVRVGDSITITCNGSSGAVDIDAKKINVKASGGLNLKADGPVRIDGASVEAQAGSGLKLNSSAAVKIGGQVISIG